MNTNGVPVFIAAFMVSAILLACTSPAEPPATVKSWPGKRARRPADAPPPGHHSIGGQILIAHAEEPAVVLGEQPRFLKGIAVQHQRHALPRSKFSALVLLGGA